MERLMKLIKLKLVNLANGTINLTGEDSVAIYAKRGLIENSGKNFC